MLHPNFSISFRFTTAFVLIKCLFGSLRRFRRNASLILRFVVCFAGRSSPTPDAPQKSQSLDAAVLPAPLAPPAGAVSHKTLGVSRPPPGTQKQPAEFQEQSRGKNAQDVVKLRSRCLVAICRWHKKKYSNGLFKYRSFCALSFVISNVVAHARFFPDVSAPQ